MAASPLFNTILPGPLPIIGMIHLPALTGYPNTPGIEAIIEHALADVQTLERAGVDAVLIENEHDQPHQVTAWPEIIAAMTLVSQAVVQNSRKLIVGVEILLNDPEASLAVAQASKARFIRTDYFVDRMARDEYGGEMRIDPAAVLAYRRKIKADDIAILTDIQVKYARMLEEKSIENSAAQAVEAGSDGVIISGNLTGHAPVSADLSAARSAVEQHFPVLIGSGLNSGNAEQLLPLCRGAIVGTGIMTAGKADYDKARALMQLVERQRSRWRP